MLTVLVQLPSSIIQYLETLSEGSTDVEKSEYSLTQHLANNLIDMYINLPSRNHYRRPASYASKGYRTRRMAVDFAIPLITNVKCAKIFAEALVRKLPLDISNVDCKSSYPTHTFPGLINVSAFVPNLTTDNGEHTVSYATRASISGGFTTSLILPNGLDEVITDDASLKLVQGLAENHACCNYALNVATTNSNTLPLTDEGKAEVKALFISFHDGATPPQISAVAAHFTAWANEKMIVTDARGSNLASLLLLASLHNRSIHITDVRSKEDLLLISLSKARHLKVTCDASVYTLFFTREQYPESTMLPPGEEQDFFWNKLDVIDAFSVGTLPYHLAAELGETPSAWSGVSEALPLLLSAVASGRLTLEDIKVRLHDNPIRIFGLPEQPNTHVEVVIGRRYQYAPREGYWSPLHKQFVTGSLHRVVMQGKTVYLDGMLSTSPNGKDVSATIVPHPLGETRAVAVPAAKPEPVHPLAKTIDIHPPSHAPVVSTTSVGTTTNVPHHAILSHVPHPSFHRRHILTVKQFSQKDLYDLFSLAHEMRLQVERSGTLDVLKGKVLCTLFYEPSTRTSASFDAAMKRCGGDVIQITADSSSVQKGETLADTIRTVASYADAIVVRHPDVGSAQLAAKFSPVPVFNAGDGIGEHPTQVWFVTLSGFFFLTVIPSRHCWMFTLYDQSWARSMVARLRFWVI